MKYNKLVKFTLPFALLISLCMATVANAASVKKGSGVNIMSISAGQTNCSYDGHQTDICIWNNSGYTIYFNVPMLGVQGPLNPPNMADVYSWDYYTYVGVQIKNASGVVRFNQSVPNHSIINVTPDPSATSHGKLKVTVMPG